MPPELPPEPISPMTNPNNPLPEKLTSNTLHTFDMFDLPGAKASEGALMLGP